MVGLGGLENQHFGTGVLFAQSATISGAGEREIKGAGTLQGGVASAFGSGVVYEIAVNYVCYLPPNTLALEKLSLTSSYALQFSNPKNVPNSVTVGWDDLVTYHAGNPEPTVDAYKFSGDKTFVEDQDDEY